MRLVDDKRLTKILDNNFIAGCIGCVLDDKCDGQTISRLTYDTIPKSKRACFKSLRQWLTSNER